MAKWTLTIKDNETGEIDTIETNAIMAGIDEEGGSRTLFMTHCNVIDYSATLYAAKKAVYQAEKGSSIAKVMVEAAIKDKGLDDEGAGDDE